MSKPRILIVDDEAFFRRFFSEVLAGDNRYDIDAVDSGQAALDYLERHPIDIILTDMVMPEICGLELIRRTRTLNPAPDIILATANASVETAIEALKSGARDYLLKPCNPEQLRHTIGSCVEQRRLLAENSMLQSQIRLYQRGLHLAAQLNIETLFRETLNTLANELGDIRGLAFLADQNGLSHVSAHGFEGNQAKTLAQTLLPHTITMQEATLIKVAEHPDLAGACSEMTSIWVVPMHTENQEHGSLVLCHPEGAQEPCSLPVEHLNFLIEQAAIGFRNACQFQGARELIYTDDLTGLYNHRYLHIALEQEINRSERYGLEFSLAFIDLDLFKSINDQHGHMIGSDVLRQVGVLLRECVRDADMLFRYGGDEFTALLVETDTRGARIVAERMRTTIEQYSFDTGRDNTGRLTATVGHATYPIHATTKNEMIELADKAMYMGKHDRNVSRSASEMRGT